jgi:two-component system sensor histidine kinase MprB
MTLRVRIAVAVTLAVAGASTITAVAAFIATRTALVNDLDQALRDRAAEVQLVKLVDVYGRDAFIAPDPGPGSVRSLVQLVDGAGHVQLAQGQQVELPVGEEVIEVASGVRAAFVTTTRLEDGSEVRMLVLPVVDGLALQVGLPVRGVTEPLRRLTVFLIGAGILAVASAAITGATVARAITRPVAALTATTERVAQTRDLRERIAISSPDEIGRLAIAFNTMLAALDDSTSAQRQLVADAAHELRTPIASLRTNIEVLARGLGDAPEAARAIATDLVSQAEGLSRLVADLLDLSRETEPQHAFELVAFDEVVAGALEIARAAYPSVRIEAKLEPVAVRANPTRIERAATNLIENAAKWTAPGAPVEVSLSASGTLVVRDHGPGIPREHRERIFERFWRAPDARQTSGSGLGLAIVRRIARDHGGSVHVEDAPGGGARLVFTLPPT